MSDLSIQFSNAYGVLVNNPKGSPLSRTLTEDELGKVAVVAAKLLAFVCGIVAYVALGHFSILCVLFASLSFCVGLDLMKISENCDELYNAIQGSGNVLNDKKSFLLRGTLVSKSIYEYFYKSKRNVALQMP